MSDILQASISISDLNRIVRELLEQYPGILWVRGEISNFSVAPVSGHWYFSLKDSHAQVRCVMFKSQHSRLGWKPDEGNQIEARVRVTLYEVRGDFQLNVEQIKRMGVGDLFAMFHALKTKLEAQGLFDMARKKPLPLYPNTIGVVTSLGASVLQDVLMTLLRRMPSIPVIVYPTAVQGTDAAKKIATAIDTANQHCACDVLIVCRGGGSLEDLAAFNDEQVAYAVSRSKIPIISGVGHETDTTICDFIADRRATTPTAAAELATPAREELSSLLSHYQQRFTHAYRRMLNQYQQTLDHHVRYLYLSVQNLIYSKEHIKRLYERLLNAYQRVIVDHQRRLLSIQRHLEHLSHADIMRRGYALVQTLDGHIIKQDSAIQLGQLIKISLLDRIITAKVEKLE